MLLLAIALIAYATALPTTWFRSAEVSGTILSPPPHTWIVDDDGPAHFRKIQEAINAANPGDTIYVHKGTYYENVVVNKTVSLIGENRDITIIDGKRTWNSVVYVIANNIRISGFSMQNGLEGIYLNHSSHNTIIDNTIKNNEGSGIYLMGIWGDSSYNNISGNRIVYNNAVGIFLNFHNNGNVIIKNTISNNAGGIGLTQNCNTNIITGNDIADNYNGVTLEWSSDGNIIFHNNFINNTVQVISRKSVNVWDDGYPSGGNYWSDYTDADVRSGSGQDLLGSDGIGDKPHIIDADNQDCYPLMKPWSPRVANTITLSAEPSTAPVGSDITLSGEITPVRAHVNVTIYYRLFGEASWNALTTLKTNSTGGYLFVCKPTQIATCELIAIWLGDETTLPAESTMTILNIEPIHDVAVVSVVPSTTEVYVGWKVNITVVVKNEGNATETFAVTCKYILEGMEHTIGTQTVTNFAPSTNTTLTFTWTTTDITIHTLKAEIPPLEGETDKADNTMTSPTTVKVKLLGDVNGDDKVDIRDLATAALYYGSYPSHPKWNPIADINQDNKVDIRDLVLIAKNFGKTCT